MITKMCVVFLINLDYPKVKVADILKTVGPFEFTSTDLDYAAQRSGHIVNRLLGIYMGNPYIRVST